jgi:hypothetical protein
MNVERVESIGVGATASEVLEHIVRVNQEIYRIVFAVYNLYYDSDKDILPIQSRYVLPVSDHLLDVLQEQSDKVSAVVEGDIVREYTHRGAIAITSLVLLPDSSRKYIPMADFNCEKSPENIQRIQEVLSGYPGVILETDNSYHFWSLKLLTTVEWHGFLNLCMQRATGLNAVFDEKHVYSSQARGYSALRIHAYPGDKDVEPRVIALTGGG